MEFCLIMQTMYTADAQHIAICSSTGVLVVLKRSKKEQAHIAGREPCVHPVEGNLLRNSEITYSCTSSRVPNYSVCPTPVQSCTTPPRIACLAARHSGHTAQSVISDPVKRTSGRQWQITVLAVAADPSYLLSGLWNGLLATKHKHSSNAVSCIHSTHLCF